MTELEFASSPEHIVQLIDIYIEEHPPEKGSGEAAILYIIKYSARTVFEELQEEANANDDRHE